LRPVFNNQPKGTAMTEIEKQPEEKQLEDAVKVLIKKIRPFRMLSYSPAGLAKRTSLCRNKIYKALNEKSLVGHKYDNRTVILHADAIRWLKSLPLYVPKQSNAKNNFLSPTEICHVEVK
jgi:hypothetical protein